ncbi:hypothetical protein PLESTM_001279200 [Pleodorina starrii]|nr:hypothetical protein PLESTM_001279200 [Pleodorina starrii]
MIGKCSVLGFDRCAELATLQSDVWSFRSTVVSSTPSPVLRSGSAFYGISSVRHAPPEVVGVVGQLQPLVHGRAGLPRHPPPPPPPLGGGTGGVSGSGDDADLSLAQLRQRRRSHALASTSVSATAGAATGSWEPTPAAQAGASQDWSRPSRNALLRLDQQMTAAQAAVRLLRIADEVQRLSSAGARSPAAPGRQRPATLGPDAASAGEETGPERWEVSPGGAQARADEGVGSSPRPARPTGPEEERSVRDAQRGSAGRSPTVAELGDLELFLASGSALQQQQQNHHQQHLAESLGEAQQQPAPEQPSRPPLELRLLAGLDQLALRESLGVLQLLLPRLSATQLQLHFAAQKCLETLAAVRHTPADPWFHDWLLASERQLQLQRADATEVYGMFLAMRVLRLRPQSAEWVGGAVAALSANLPQLDAVQVVELLGCFADLALRPPEGLLARAFALLLPDLPELQPRVVADLFASCSRLRVAPPAHVAAAAFAALTPAALAAAPPPALCRLAAAAAALRLQPPLAFLTAVVGRTETLLRSALAAAGDGEGTLCKADAAFSASGAVAATAAAAEPPPGPVDTAEANTIGCPLGAGSSRTLQPRRGKARRLVATAAATAATAAAEAALGSGPSSSGSSPLLTPSAPSPLTTQQLSCLLRDLRLLQAPLPAHWGDMCGRFLVAATDSSTPVVQVSYLLRSVARCGLSLPPAAVRVVTARLETSLCAASEQRRRRRLRRQRRRQALLQSGAAGADAEGADDWDAVAQASVEDGDDGGGRGGGGIDYDDDGDEARDPADSPLRQWTPQVRQGPSDSHRTSQGPSPFTFTGAEHRLRYRDRGVKRSRRACAT